MVTFNKKTEQLADVLFNGVKIGHVERYGQTLTLEISYLRIDLSYSKRKLIGTLAKKIYTRLEARKQREQNRPVSLLVTGNYQILD